MSCIVLALKMSQVCHTKAFLGLILQFKVDTLQAPKSLFLGGVLQNAVGQCYFYAGKCTGVGHRIQLP